MTRRACGVGLMMIALLAFGAEAGAQEQASPPRMSDGKPSLEGVWTNSSVTDLQRPNSVSKLVLTPAEARAVEDADQNVARMRNANEVSDPKVGLLDGSDLLAGRGYNSFWVDPGVKIATVKGELRSSWIVDPPSGKIPYSQEGRKKASSLAINREDFSGPEARPLGERCIAIGNRVGPPMVNGLYNNNYQFIQTPESVVIYVEMIPHARVIRLNSRHAPTEVTPVFGDTIGWWEGDTLVAETTNFNPVHAANAAPANLSTQAKVTERFTRVSKDQILYEFKVEDPTFYSQPWRGEMSLNARRERMFEYACHEGNYSMEGVLMGARVQEKSGKPKSTSAAARAATAAELRD
jgi:hypothetical protein